MSERVSDKSGTSGPRRGHRAQEPAHPEGSDAGTLGRHRDSRQPRAARTARPGDGRSRAEGRGARGAPAAPGVQAPGRCDGRGWLAPPRCPRPTAASFGGSEAGSSHRPAVRGRAPRDAPLSPGTHDRGGRSGAADIPREARARGSAPRADRDPDPRGGGAAGGLGAGGVSRSRPRSRLPRSRGASHALLGFSHFRFFLTVPPPCQWRAFS